jgi:pilus assembly protein Flp/PilA
MSVECFHLATLRHDINLEVSREVQLEATAGGTGDNVSPTRFAVLPQLREFWKDETAATAVEYGIIAAGIAVAIIAVLKGLGVKLNTTFTSVQTALK